MRSVTFTGITIAIAFTLHATDAWSCSPGEVSGISLVDGAVEVPRNASIFFAMGDAPSNATLVHEASGARTELGVNFEAPVTAVALINLAPATAYRVELDLFENASGVIEPSNTLHFTTAANADEVQPAIDEIDSDVSSEKIDGGFTFGEGCSLSPLPYWREERVESHVTFNVDVSPDTVMVRLFRIVDGARQDRGLVFTSGATSVRVEDFTSDTGEASYRIVAVDAAGNASNEDVEASLGALAGSCSQAGATTVAPIAALLVLLLGRARICRRIARR